MTPYGLSAEIWAIIGAVFIVIEFLTVALIPVFFGIGALITALCTWIGLTQGIAAQLLCFSISSLTMLVVFRGAAKRLFAKGAPASQEYSDFIGQKVIVTEEIRQGREGRVQFRGAEWIASTRTDREFAKGEQVVVTAVDGIKLYVQSENS